MTRANLLFWMLAITAVTSEASAQAPNLVHAQDGRYDVSLSFGLDPAVIGSVGVTRWTDVAGKVMGLSMEATVPVAELDLHDYRLAGAASASLARAGSLHIGARLGLSARGTQNMNFTAHGFGADITMYVGHYGRRARAALEIGYDKSVLTHIEHRPLYLRSYPEAVDGWYSASGGTVRLGVTAGVSIGQVDLGLRFYMARSEAGEDVIPPLGAMLSLARSF